MMTWGLTFKEKIERKKTVILLSSDDATILISHQFGGPFKISGSYRNKSDVIRRLEDPFNWN